VVFLISFCWSPNHCWVVLIFSENPLILVFTWCYENLINFLI
jgi:hypothetical protein